MNYITELNKMYHWCMTKKRSKSEIALLSALYMIDNAEDWAVWFEADNEYIQRLTGGLSRESINEARNKLKQQGRIDFKEGTRNIQSAKYMIIPFEVDIQVDMKVDEVVDIPVDIQVDTISKQNKTKQNKEKNKKEKVAHENSKQFIPPMVDEVRAYCLERKNGIDAEAFIAHYTAVGWVYGKDRKPVKDWKSCVITWEKNNKNVKASGGDSPFWN